MVDAQKPRDLGILYTAPQKTLDVIQAFAVKVGVIVSTVKTKHVTVAIKAARKLAIHLQPIRICAHQLA